ncbi:hypothetical protein C1H46_012550 [Malus baccata]|uniref:Ubiquitin-like protease family profile domain-containing protein n=1 Tax=Malus baccata TaxID=106549 RepID=A0A540MSZ7_MALBA|nr:hypothetical protein C1H46_012550 [Malus baccata]
MFDDVEAGTDVTPKDESKGAADADQDFEATLSSGPKGKAKKGYHTRVGALPSSSRSSEFEFVSKRQFEEFSMTMEVRLRTVVKALEEEQRARMKLVAELERLQSDAPGKSFNKPLALEKLEDKNTKVIEYGTHMDEGTEVNEATGPSSSEPFLGRKVSDGRLIEDFFVVLKPMWIILKPDVEVFIDVLTHWVGRHVLGFCFVGKSEIVLQRYVQKKMKQEYAQFMTLVAGNGKGKSKAKAKEALVFTPSKHLMKVVSADATMMPHMLAWNDVNQVSIPCHVNGNHWMLVDVHLLLRTITIYDSH